MPDERQQKLSLVRQPFRFLRTGLAGKIDGVCLEREHAVQTVPQPLLQIQQITPDKAGRQADMPTTSGGRARRDPPCIA